MSSISPFRKMVHQLAKHLTVDDVNDLIYLAECEIADNSNNRQKLLYCLVDKLKEDGRISENNVDILIELLGEIESKDALRLVEIYKTSFAGGQEFASNYDAGLTGPAVTDLHRIVTSESDAIHTLRDIRETRRKFFEGPRNSTEFPSNSGSYDSGLPRALGPRGWKEPLTFTRQQSGGLHQTATPVPEEMLTSHGKDEPPTQLLEETRSPTQLRSSSGLHRTVTSVSDEIYTSHGKEKPPNQLLEETGIPTQLRPPSHSEEPTSMEMPKLKSKWRQPSVKCLDNTKTAEEDSSDSFSKKIEMRDVKGDKVLNIFPSLPQILKTFGISTEVGKQMGVNHCMTLDEMHLKEGSIAPIKVVIAFLTRLMSYDYRAMRLFKELEPIAGSANYDAECSGDATVVADFKLSCRDMTFIILNCCDPFLRQEVLSKMTNCQLAVPVLLPTIEHREVILLLWGLQKIKKVWRDSNSDAVNEEHVVEYPFPVVSVLRVGNVDLSKSNILNKMLGPIQNNDDHPYFLSSEQDSRQSILSQGTLEGIWYLPGSRKKSKYSLRNAICFLNLRGDAEEYHKQRKYVAKLSTITIVFLTKSNLPSKTPIVKEIAASSNVILVMCGKCNMSMPSKETAAGNKIIHFDASGFNTLDIGEYLCTEVNQTLSHPGNEFGHRLQNSLSICAESNIDVDHEESVCKLAKQASQDILSLYKDTPKKFKSVALPLQFKWKKWSKLDKDRSWKSVQGNIERQLANLQHEKEEERKSQREIGLSAQMKKLYQELSNADEKYKQFLVFWLEHFLNEKSIASLKPLVETLKRLRDEVRETAAKITYLKRKLDDGSSISEKEREKIEQQVKDHSDSETKLNKQLVETTNEFDACSLGFEHFIREFGQLYECFHNCQQIHENVTFFDVKPLPAIVAGILLNGHPVEIFDGDACHVPIKWVKGILSAVSAITRDCRIYVISVIGIQSSGKSTLLNSMFGVRFAVSAGRCTRGIFLQLLPIDENLKEELGCDYIAVIDTEGLKAPEKAVANRKNEDNELATFALCLSDMTLINIGGQTVGEDLSNILQISAHAFIRMKEVNLRSSCYLIQQFVADVTASQRNQSSTQSILHTLDQAVVTAATEEGKQDQYRQFSDCFNIINLDSRSEDVQYVPSLWRNAMSAPNYEYSETVLQLKSALLRNVKQKEEKQRISEFGNRIESVWNAVKQEDFVFNFRNTTEIAQYSNFTFLYKRAQLTFTQEMMTWELDAMQKIRNTAAENVLSRRNSLFQELNEKLSTEVEQLHKKIEKELRKREYESVRHHATYFTMDIDMVQKQIGDTIRQMLSIESSIITDAKTKDNQLLPQMKAKLRQQVLPVAEKLKHLLSDDSNISQKSEDEKDVEIERAFHVEWSKQMKDVQLQHPTESEDKLRKKIEYSMLTCISQSLENTGLSMEMKKLLNHHTFGELCYSSPKITTADDINHVASLIRTPNDAVTGHLKNLLAVAKEELSRRDFLFSVKFVESLRGDLKLLVNERCDGCNLKTELLVCFTCQVLVQSFHVTLENVLSELLRDESHLTRLRITNVHTQESIREDITSKLRTLQHKYSQNKITKAFNFVTNRLLSLWQPETEVDDNFFNDLQMHLEKLRAKQRRKHWYTEQLTTEFLQLALKLISEKYTTTDRGQQLLSQACNFYFQEAVRCEKQFLSQNLPWRKVKHELRLEAIEFEEQKSLLLKTLQDILPELVVTYIKKMDFTAIQKFATVPFFHRQHVLDLNFLLLVSPLSTAKYDNILAVIEDSQEFFLTLLKGKRVYNTNAMKTVITSTMEELQRLDLEIPEQVLTIAFVCSWGLPICQALQINFVREHSMEYLLEQEREHLYSEFRDLCRGACQDQLEAKSLSSIIEVSLTESLQNRVCSALFERLVEYGDEIFCSRARFLKVILKSLCLKENFHDYTSFICQHNSFITKWTLNYIATQCSDFTEEGICIRNIVAQENGKLLNLTENSLQAALRSVEQCNNPNISFQDWLKVFMETFEKNVKSTLNEEAISGLRKYTHVSDFSLFTEECIENIKGFTESLILESLSLPDPSSLSEVEEWFKKLPKQIHVLMAEGVQGCGSRCPFCWTFCDDTVKEHKVHFSNLHFPRGVGGGKYKGSGELTCETCTANVASDRSYYNCGCPWDKACSHPTIKFKDYRTDFPEWDIQPITDYEPTLYWKWVLTKFNDDFADYYGGKPAQIPWGEVTKGQALSSIENN